MSEEWKIIEGSNGNYQVSTTGHIKSDRSNIIMKPWVSTGGGYMFVRMVYGGERKNVAVHRLVALAFIPNPFNKKTEIMTTQEIKTAAIRVINNVITLKANVSNGCVSDQDKLEAEEKRLEGIKNWAISNDQIKDICYYLGSKNFGQNNQFAASEVRSFFNN